MAENEPSIYFMIYNGVQSGGWTFVVLALLKGILEHDGDLAGAGFPAWKLLTTFQCLMVLEVVHRLIGWSRSALVPLILQVFGRLAMLSVIYACEDVCTTDRFAMQVTTVLFLAFALVELIRYPHFTLLAAGHKNAVLHYLRYTAFLAFYPLGLGAEWTMLYTVRDRGCLIGKLPYAPYILNAALILHPMAAVVLFMNMLQQRRRKLGGDAKGKGKSKAE